jgi:hypothetical protein
MSERSARLPVLSRDSGNYKQWSAQMKASLMIHGSLHIWIEKEPDVNDAKEEESDSFAKARIQLQVSGPFREIVERAKTAKAAWEALKEDYAGSVEVRKPALMRALVNLEQGRDSAQQYVDKAKGLREEFDELGMKDFVQFINFQFIHGLNDEWGATCAATLNEMLVVPDVSLEECESSDCKSNSTLLARRVRT